jgi:hypothetical protein
MILGGNFGGADCYGHPGCLINAVHIYTKYFRVFTCSGYKTTTCPGTIISTDNGELKHYAQEESSPQELINRAVAWLEEKTLVLIAPAHAAGMH